MPLQIGMIGFDPRFVESELAMMDSIRKGTGVTHHLEPSYYAAMLNALNAVEGLPAEPLTSPSDLPDTEFV